MKSREVKIAVKGFGKIPFYATKQAAGCDVYAANAHNITIPPHESAKVPTGIYLEISDDSEVQVRGRSGLAFKNNIVAYLGTIDADYTGEIGVLLFNHSDEPFIVERGDRVAQLVFNGDGGIYQADFTLVPEISKVTDRGSNGFGHTGKK